MSKYGTGQTYMYTDGSPMLNIHFRHLSLDLTDSRIEKRKSDKSIYNKNYT